MIMKARRIKDFLLIIDLFFTFFLIYQLFCANEICICYDVEIKILYNIHAYLSIYCHK